MRFPFVCRIGVLALFAGAGSLAPALAAEPTRVRIVVASDQRIREDLKYLVDLAPENLRKQWAVLAATLESFEGGVTLTKPIAVDILFGGTELAYHLTVPVLKWDDKKVGFKQNLIGFGFKVNPAPGGLFQLDQAVAGGKKKSAAPAAKPFFFKQVGDYGFLAPTAAALANVPNNPLAELLKFVPDPIDFAARLENDAAQMSARRATFQELRKQLDAAVKFKRGEAEADFELRKMSSRHSLEEAERFLIESQELALTWTTNIAAKYGRGEVKLTALPGTSLAESIELLNQKPSYFANLKWEPKGILQARVNFALDPMRVAHGQEMYEKMLPVMKSGIETRPNLNAEGKVAARKALDLLFAMLTDGLTLKTADIYIDAHATADGKHAGICGLRAADGRKAVECLELFPTIRAGWKFAKNVGQHAGADLHTVTIAPHRLEEFGALFGGEPIIHVATSEKAVWAATGDGSLAKLKAALDAVGQPAPATIAPEFVDVTMKFGPWIDLLDVFRAKEPKPAANDKAALEEEKRRVKVRKFAKEAFAPGGDTLEAKLRRKDGTVDGELTIGEGILRFVGATVANFVAENLN